LALTAIRCGAQNSVAIGDSADITGLESVGGSIENDPLRKSGGPKCCDAQSALILLLVSPKMLGFEERNVSLVTLKGAAGIGTKRCGLTQLSGVDHSAAIDPDTFVREVILRRTISM
jgi:hypothetical protein